MGDLKFYMDEHIPKAVVKGLKKRGIDAVSCVEERMREASDREHLKYALKSKRVLVTYDSDFVILHNSGQTHSGIAYARKPLSIGEIISILLYMHEVLELEDMKNQIEFI
ncbi:MAG: DUF5615 family PIN-like protein [Bacteroidota bacterium]